MYLLYNLYLHKTSSAGSNFLFVESLKRTCTFRTCITVVFHFFLEQLNIFIAFIGSPTYLELVNFTVFTKPSFLISRLGITLVFNI